MRVFKFSLFLRRTGSVNARPDIDTQVACLIAAGKARSVCGLSGSSCNISRAVASGDINIFSRIIWISFVAIYESGPN